MPRQRSTKAAQDIIDSAQTLARVAALLEARGFEVPSSILECQETSCGHSASINVDGLPESFPVPDMSLRLRLGVRLAEREGAAGSERV